ncbi:FAD-binding oxidoreductase [Kaustia mangrovi]|uniref:FAD-binding oxidoreductase n=1 Tax=Kaustia mangrovi TaxID=2593653 RepID=A0A7S8C787_9HYPH|nr:FAD-binding oxidoreductase [Kaustia mangrovi]QPC44649.1 FAD-binding oxidoreductase [Kaustia mangrovi]
MAQTTLDELRQLLTPRGVICGADETARYLQDWRGIFRGQALAVLRPGSAGEVAGALAICQRAGIAVVPQGGNTGMVGGSVPSTDAPTALLSLERLDAIREIDTIDDTMTVEAGCILADIQAAAREADRLFPLSLGAEGSCRIGGNIATNAGGVHVLRYGMTRDLVMGLEVALPDGTLWNGLRRLRKDNTGYDLKQLFIGSEGTLGVVTAAVVKLFPRPREHVVALLAIPEPAAALTILGRLRQATGDRVAAIELMMRVGIDISIRHVPGARDPLEAPYPAYLLVELATPRADEGLAALFEGLLPELMEAGLVLDGTIAANEAQAESLWALREGITEGLQHEGIQLKHDVSVPVSRIPAFLAAADEAVARVSEAVRIVAFGHVGDGNVHYNLILPARLDAAGTEALREPLTHAVYDTVSAFDGSISAEHGLGQLKAREIARYKTPLELALMRRIKQALDPDGLMNPGKVFADG